jgi:hypothetical protein
MSKNRNPEFTFYDIESFMSSRVLFRARRFQNIEHRERAGTKTAKKNYVPSMRGNRASLLSSSTRGS